jgi:hypothetical protein
MKIYKIFFIAFLSLIIASCKKQSKGPEPDGSSTPPPTGTYILHLHTYLDNNEVDAYNIVYTNDAGRKISLSMAQLYLSELQLVKADGTTIPFTGTKIFKVLEKETYMVGEAPVGNYKGIRFSVGLNPDKQNPHDANDSTILNKPAMWFSSNPQQDGYIFLNMQGTIDTTSDASSTAAQMQTFNIKIGTSSNFKEVAMPEKNFTIMADQVEYGHVLIDYSQLFSGISLNTSANLSVTSPADNASSNAVKIASNIPLMFKYEQ